jgi:hypothetical protein
MNPTLKGAFKSKTMWISALVAVIGVIEAKQPLVIAYFPPYWQGIATIAIGVIGGVVRVFTSTSLFEKGVGKPDDTDNVGA